jgi:hypothetical protein
MINSYGTTVYKKFGNIRKLSEQMPQKTKGSHVRRAGLGNLYVESFLCTFSGLGTVRMKSENRCQLTKQMPCDIGSDFVLFSSGAVGNSVTCSVDCMGNSGNCAHPIPCTGLHIRS